MTRQSWFWARAALLLSSCESVGAELAETDDLAGAGRVSVFVRVYPSGIGNAQYWDKLQSATITPRQHRGEAFTLRIPTPPPGARPISAEQVVQLTPPAGAAPFAAGWDSRWEQYGWEVEVTGKAGWTFKFNRGEGPSLKVIGHELTDRAGVKRVVPGLGFDIGKVVGTPPRR